MDTYPAGTFFQLGPWVVFFPFVGLLINLLFSRKFSERTIGLVASIASGASFVVACLLFRSLQIHPEAVVVTSGKMDRNWEL